MTGTNHQPHHLNPTRRRSTSWLIACAVLVVAIIAVIMAILLNHNGSANSAGHAPAAQPNLTTSSAPTTGSSTSTTATSTTAKSSTSAASTSASRAASASQLARRASTNAGSSTAANAGKARTITYVVKPGDNLFVIAKWFKMHGYGAIYDRNKAVLGDNPSLIHPGQRITISGTSMSAKS